jgi:hypothetical protein
VPHLRDEPHLGWAVGEIIRELELCLEEATLTAIKKNEKGSERNTNEGVRRG